MRPRASRCQYRCCQPPMPHARLDGQSFGKRRNSQQSATGQHACDTAVVVVASLPPRTRFTARPRRPKISVSCSVPAGALVVRVPSPESASLMAGSPLRIFPSPTTSGTSPPWESSRSPSPNRPASRLRSTGLLWSAAMACLSSPTSTATARNASRFSGSNRRKRVHALYAVFQRRVPPPRAPWRCNAASR